MVSKLIFSEEFEKTVEKLKNKDKAQFEYLIKKIRQIKENPKIGKPLSGALKGKRRVHAGSFVLIYEITESERIVRILHYDHHDYIYHIKR